MTILTGACWFFKEECMDKELTMPERREFLWIITEIIKSGALNRDERNRILRICVSACDRIERAMR